MLKAMVLLGTGFVAFVLAFSFTASDEIGAKVSDRLESDFVNQCAARARFSERLKPFAREICGCMKAEFDAKGLSLMDAFGKHRVEMQQIGARCAADYA